MKKIIISILFACFLLTSCDMLTLTLPSLTSDGDQTTTNTGEPTDTSSTTVTTTQSITQSSTTTTTTTTTQSTTTSTTINISDKCIITFDSNGGSSVEQQEISYGGKIKKPETPVKPGYEFEGWYIEDEKWVFNVYPVTESITLVAIWKPIEYYISLYDEIGGYSNFYTIYYGEEFYLPENPTQPGLFFHGWYDENDNLVESGYHIFTELENKTYFAKWSNCYLEPAYISIDGDTLIFDKVDGALKYQIYVNYNVMLYLFQYLMYHQIS